MFFLDWIIVLYYHYCGAGKWQNTNGLQKFECRTAHASKISREKVFVYEDFFSLRLYNLIMETVDSNKKLQAIDFKLFNDILLSIHNN